MKHIKLFEEYASDDGAKQVTEMKLETIK